MKKITRIITKEQLRRMSTEKVIEATKGYALDIYMNDGQLTQLCVNDFMGYDDFKVSFYTRTGILIPLQDIEEIKITKVEDE